MDETAFHHIGNKRKRRRKELPPDISDEVSMPMTRSRAALPDPSRRVTRSMTKAILNVLPPVVGRATTKTKTVLDQRANSRKKSTVRNARKKC